MRVAICKTKEEYQKALERHKELELEKENIEQELNVLECCIENYEEQKKIFEGISSLLEKNEIQEKISK
ncbi:hypothetical protein [Clostridium sp.]|uniref:hypothetical protein n=1 Tax=Clostridium sp. TaxID=1506 RepID=UPI003F3F1047